MTAPKISVVIPVYNTEAYLQQCIDSVLNQTLRDVEVICVDDGSRDSSCDILRDYARRDERVKAFFFETSQSALIARKKGVMEATGEYIMFLDADDYLEERACEKLYQKIKEAQVDILHFTSRVLNCANLSQKRIDWNQNAIRPLNKRLDGEAVFRSCFVDKKYFFTLWNKVYEAAFCKRAFAAMEDRRLPKAQDLYSYFVLSRFAKSYLGWESGPLHNYCMGRGVVGSSSMNLDKFERYCTQVHVADALSRFAEEEGFATEAKGVIDEYRDQWLRECVLLWKNELPGTSAAAGWEVLCRYWGKRDTIARTAQLFWQQFPEVAKKLHAYPRLSLQGREIKTIAFYYYHFTIGGVQRVMSLLAPMFREMGYQVVIITDSEETEADFPLPEGVCRASVRSYEITDENTLGCRLDSWQRLIDEYHIDMVLYHAWTFRYMLWDFLYLKESGIPVVVHSHSVFSYPVCSLEAVLTEICRVLPLADGMTVLSEADKAFWDAYLDNVHFIPNPIMPELETAKSASSNSRTLIWVGRTSAEKQPEAVFTIMEEVLRQVKDAKLLLLGDFDDPKWKKLAADKGIGESVTFCGMVRDVAPYYEKASVLVSTSLYEGFPMTILEAQAHALPTVMFEMPHMTLGKRDKGTISVPMLDCRAAADEIAKLLTDEDYWSEYSRRARSSYEYLLAYDYRGAWTRLLSGEKPPCSITAATADMIHTFVNHYEQGLKSRPDVYNSPAFRLGYAITYIPGRIKRLLNVLRKKGLKYTVKKSLQFIKGR